jgi:hypothetical protein
VLRGRKNILQVGMRQNRKIIQAFWHFGPNSLPTHVYENAYGELPKDHTGLTGHQRDICNSDCTSFSSHNYLSSCGPRRSVYE